MPITVNIEADQNEIRRRNAEWRIRLHRQLDALCDDAEARKGFWGFVFLQVNYQGKVTSVKTNIEQTITK
jgi:hypothetical protein